MSKMKAVLDRKQGNIRIYRGGDMVISIWNVSGLELKEGYSLIKQRKRTIGTLWVDEIKEEW